MRAILILLLIAGCAPQAVETVPQEQQMQGATVLREQHPEWYACATDDDCASVVGECGSNCRRESVNSEYYSDYVVAFSKTCTQATRTIGNCAQAKSECNDNVCELTVLYE